MRSTIIVMSIILVFLILFFLLSYLSVLVPAKPIRENLQRAFVQGELQHNDWPWSRELTRRIGFNQYDDCLTFQMTILRTEYQLEDAISPNVLWRWPFEQIPRKSQTSENAWSVCAALQHVISSEDTNAVKRYYHRYHRYLHGHRVLASFLLQWISVRSLRFLLKGLCYAALAIGIITCSVKLLQQISIHGPLQVLGKSSGFAAAAGLVIFVSLFLFYGLKYYSMSITHAPSDIVLFSFLLYCIRTNLLEISRIYFYIVVTVLACFIVIFDRLAGASAMGLALVIAMLAVRSDDVTNIKSFFSRCVGGTLAYAITIVCCVLGKQVVASFFFDSVWDEFFNKLALRTTGSHGPLKSVNLADLADSLGHYMYIIGYKSEGLGTIILLSSFALFVGVSIVFVHHLPRQRARTLGLTISVLVIPAWFFVFREHAREHSVFMVRLLSWPIVVGILSLLQLMDSILSSKKLRAWQRF